MFKSFWVFLTDNNGEIFIDKNCYIVYDLKVIKKFLQKGKIFQIEFKKKIKIKIKKAFSVSVAEIPMIVSLSQHHHRHHFFFSLSKKKNKENNKKN